MAKKRSPKSYEDAFSGRTKAILLTLSHIFLDSGLDVRSKHMFGHKAFLLNGRPFVLVGEWARQESPEELNVSIADRGTAEATLIVIPIDAAMAEGFRKEHGGMYFAPKGTRLKNWLSFTGPWLMDEATVLPVIQTLMDAYAALPEKTGVANPGRRV